MAKIEQVTPARPVKVKLVNVAAYARVSTASQRQLSSIATQVSYYSRLIQSTPGWTYAGVFTDEGITGTKTSGRQGLADLMNLAREGGVDIVLCKSISRLARNTVDLLDIVRELKNLGVSIRFERENIDTASADGELLLTLLASFAQEESASLSANVKWAIRKGFKQGKTNSFVLYGYRWDGKRFHIHEREAEAIRRIYTGFLAGTSPEKIVAQLNAEGYRSLTGKSLEPNLARRILKNERYTGNQMLQKTFIPRIGTNREVKNTGELERFWVEDSHPPIIDMKTFQQVKTELARRRKLGLAATPSIATGCFTSRIKCGSCGRNYQRKTRYRKTGAYKIWRCWGACLGKGNTCEPDLKETHLKQAVIKILALTKWDEEEIMSRLTSITVMKDELIFTHDDQRQTTIALDQLEGE